MTALRHAMPRVGPTRSRLWPRSAQFVALLPSRARVLDVGCGPAHDAVQLQARGLRVCGLDRSRGMLAQAQRRTAVPLLLGDMRRRPCPDESLDGVWASASFLHIPRRDSGAVLAEFRRVLRPSGALYLGVKQGDGERYVADESGQRRFFAFYQEHELDTLLEHAGFAMHTRMLVADMSGREPWLNRLALTR